MSSKWKKFAAAREWMSRKSPANVDWVEVAGSFIAIGLLIVILWIIIKITSIVISKL